jgi:hypothetical protein
MKISCLYLRHVTQQSVPHPFPLGPRGQSVPNSLRSLFVILQTCKKDTKCLALWEKRLWRQFSHIFLSVHKFSVLHSSRVGGNLNWKALILCWLDNSSQTIYLHLACVQYMQNGQHCLKALQWKQFLNYKSHLPNVIANLFWVNLIDGVYFGLS